MFAVCKTSVLITCLRNVKSGKVENLWSRINTTIISTHTSKDDADTVVASHSREVENSLSIVPPKKKEKEKHMWNLETVSHLEIEHSVLEISDGAFITLETGI